MRRSVALLAALLAGACGGDNETIVTVTVTATTDPGATTLPPRLPAPLPPDGTLPVDAFNAYTKSIDEPWERNLADLTSGFVEAGASDAPQWSFQSTTRGESASAALTFDGLFDDSVRAVRYDLELSRRDDGTWNVDSASWSQRCQKGRGHQTFSPELCL